MMVQDPSPLMHSFSTPEAAFYVQREERWVQLVGPSTSCISEAKRAASFSLASPVDSETDGSASDLSYDQEETPALARRRSMAINGVHSRLQLQHLDSSVAMDLSRATSGSTTIPSMFDESLEDYAYTTPVMSPLCGALRVTSCYISPNKALVRTDTDLELEAHSRSVGKGMTKSQSLDNIIDMVCAAEQAIQEDTLPELTLEGTGGTYFVKDASGTKVGVYKPSDEEVSSDANPRGCSEVLKKSIPAGHGWRREIAAYRLDHGHFAGVPETFQMRLPKSYFHSASDKVGSFQRFVPSDAESWDVLPGVLPVEHIHRIAILDIRLCNSDRHGGNVLVVKGEDDSTASRLVPIDHGCCLPMDLTELEFEWLLWSQSKQPMSQECIDYIRALDGAQDARILVEELGISRECADYVQVSTCLLQIATDAGLTLRDVGEMMRRPQLDTLSNLESVVREAKDDDGFINFVKIEPLLAAMIQRVTCAGE